MDAPKDAILTVTVERIDGADGASIFSTSEFSDHDAERLAELLQKYPPTSESEDPSAISKVN